MSKAIPPVTQDLPQPRLQGDRSLEEILADRRSVREFTDKPLTDTEISQLLWARGVKKVERSRLLFDN